MRKYISKILLILIMMIPVLVNADNVNYSKAVDRANNYINKSMFSDKNKYINRSTRMYVYENGYLTSIARFRTGGMLSKSEYELSQINENSYLTIGQKYWTLTNSSSGKQYYIENYLDEKSTDELAGVRSTIFAKPKVYVVGKGTYNIPWEFKVFYTVKITPKNYGSVDCVSGNTNCTKVNKTVTQDKIESGANASFVVTPNAGYKYNANDTCNLKKVSGNTYSVNKVTGDKTCVVEFEPRTYALTLSAGNNITYKTAPNPSTLYFKHTVGWFRNSNATTSISSITKPERIGYTFKGYKYGSTDVIDENGNILNNVKTTIPGFNLSGSDSQSIVAQWNANQYEVTYNSNGGSGTMDNSNATYDSDFKTRQNTFTRTGYTFNGWNEKADGTGTAWTLTSNGVYEANKTWKWTYDKSITLYAQWKPNTYSLAYSLDGGNYGTNHPTSATYDTSFTVNNPNKSVTAKFNAGTTGATISNSGSDITSSYTFNGWDITGMDNVTHTLGSSASTNTTASGIKATSFKNLRSTSGTVTFKATWTPPEITLRTVTKAGYTCKWTCTDGLEWASGGKYSPSASGGATSRTFNASCSANQVTVTFAVNGGNAWTSSTCGSGYTLSGTTCKKSVTYDLTYGSMPTPTRTGYTFKGWYKESSFTNKIETSTKMQTANAHTLYAKWADETAPTCTVTKSNTEKTSGVTTTVTCSDNGSGCKSDNSTGDAGLKTNKTYTVYDNAGNSGTCTVSISSQVQKRTRTWNNCKSTTTTCHGGYVWGNWGGCNLQYGLSDDSTQCIECKPGIYQCRSKQYNNCSYTTNDCVGGWNDWNSWSNVNSCTSDSYTQCQTLYK